jgi:hypothetical protein
MKILHLTLKKKWFDLIASGMKTEEYRAINPYWTTRLVPNRYDVILFRNGYSRNSPKIMVELKDIFVGLGSTGLGAPEGQRVFILLLGRKIDPIVGTGGHK